MYQSFTCLLLDFQNIAKCYLPIEYFYNVQFEMPKEEETRRTPIIVLTPMDKVFVHKTLVAKS